MPISSIPLRNFSTIVSQPNVRDQDVVSVDGDGTPRIKSEFQTEKDNLRLGHKVEVIKKGHNDAFDAFISSLETAHGRHSNFMKRPGIMALHNIKESGTPLRARHIRIALDDSPLPTKSRMISIGGGPRGIGQVSEEIQFLKKHQKDFAAIEKLGGKYNMTTMVMDKGKFDDLGRGTAWTEQNKEGTVNTGAERGYEERMPAYYRANKNKILAELKDHPVAKAMFKAALTEGKDGSILIDRAALTRAIQGREELEHFKNLLAVLDNDELHSMYKLVLMPETEVTGIDLSNPKMPVVETDRGKWTADIVRLNTGTVVAPPLDPGTKEDVLRHSYIGPMSSERVKEKRNYSPPSR